MTASPQRGSVSLFGRISKVGMLWCVNVHVRKQLIVCCDLLLLWCLNKNPCYVCFHAKIVFSLKKTVGDYQKKLSFKQFVGVKILTLFKVSLM